MIPSVLSSQVKKGVEDFLKETLPVSTPFFHGVMDRLLGEDGGVFKGPYLSIKLPSIFRLCLNFRVEIAGLIIKLRVFNSWNFGHQ